MLRGVYRRKTYQKSTVAPDLCSSTVARTLFLRHENPLHGSNQGCATVEGVESLVREQWEHWFLGADVEHLVVFNVLDTADTFTLANAHLELVTGLVRNIRSHFVFILPSSRLSMLDAQIAVS